MKGTSKTKRQPVGDVLQMRRRIAQLERDEAKRKQAEDALRASEERLLKVIRSNADGIIIVDREGIVLYVNPAAEAILGRKAEELLGEDFGFPVMAGETTELDIVHRGGERAVAEMRVVETEWEGESAYLASLRDITERKWAEGEKQRMEQQLQLAGRLAAVGELAAGVAHELNNPLSSIQAYAQLINDRTDLDETMRDDVETIYREAQRASKITSNLLSFAQKHYPEKRPISMNDALVSSLELHAYRMRVNNIDILIELEADLPMTLADFHQMQQVFVNIITNAEQAMSEAHGRGKLSLETQKVGEMIHISFTDDGPGIPEENIERIFDPFFTTKEVGKGTGLGLSICYGIVQDHGGCIDVISKPGQGATFVVEIPIKTERELTAFYEGDTAMRHRQMDSVGKR